MEAWWDKFFETQQMVDAKRREDLLAAFEAATVTKSYKPMWRPASYAYSMHRTHPGAVVDNWSAAWKVRRFWEEQTERRKAAGKVIY